MREKKEFFLFFFLCFVCGLLLLGDKKGLIKPVRGILERPILAAEGKIYPLNYSINQLLNYFSSKSEFQKKIRELEEENRRFAADQNALSSCLEENAKMRRLLGAPLPAKWKFLPAKVVGVSEEMRIDKGEKDGLKKGMIVVSENILVGQISEVGENFSMVQMPITSGVKIPVIVRRPTNPQTEVIQARGLLVGQSGGLILDRVLQNEEIQKGDLVITGGSEDWPADLLIGQIGEVLPKSAQIYQKARVKPLIDYNNLRIVFVIISK